MKVTLVQPPRARYGVNDLAPPLGLLSIAAILEQESIDVSILDFNLEGAANPSWVDQNFYDAAIAMILAQSPDLVGFTSMMIDSHVALELGRRLKLHDDSIKTLFGGPHFSAIAKEVLQYYPWVDFVVLGEGEYATRDLLRALKTGTAFSNITNLAYRQQDQIHYQRVYKPLNSLNELPFPAYHLVGLERYYQVNPGRLLHFEHARGCNLRCSFCYSPTHWGQGEQTKQIDQIVAQMARHKTLGAQHLFFVSDNLLNNKRWAISLCDALSSAKLDVRWNAYATLAQLTPEVITALSKASCRAVFIGVDAVSEGSKQNYKKRFFRGWSPLQKTLSDCLAQDITPTCAFMLEPPGADDGSRDLTFSTAVAAFNLGCGIRLNTVSVYNGTALADEFDHFYPTTIKPRTTFDTHQINKENPLAKAHPALYPFHATPYPVNAYEDYVTKAFIAYTLLHNYPRSLMQLTGASACAWTLVEQVAAEMSNIENNSAPGTGKRQKIDQAFRKVMHSRLLPASVRDTLTFETAEIDIANQQDQKPVRISTAEQNLSFALASLKKIRLRALPVHYETVQPRDVSRLALHDYVALRSSKGISYLSLSRAAGELLEKLTQAPDHETINFSHSDLLSLINAGVLIPRPPIQPTELNS